MTSHAKRTAVAVAPSATVSVAHGECEGVELVEKACMDGPGTGGESLAGKNDERVKAFGAGGGYDELVPSGDAAKILAG